MIRTLLPALLLALPVPAAPLAVENGAQPTGGIVDVELTELWRAGGEDDDVFFGNVLQVLPGTGGETYVLDVQLVQVFVFDADGEFVRTLGSEGEGPGQVNNANSMLTLADGTVGVGQVLPGKLELIAPDGAPTGSVRIKDPDAPDSGFVLLLGGQANADFMVLAGMRWSMNEAGEMGQDMFLRRYALDGEPAVDYFTKVAPINTTHFVFDELNFDFVWNRFGLLPDGRIAFAPERNAYEIRICSADGAVENVITRDYKSYKRSDADIKRAELTNEAIGAHYGRPLMGVTVEKTEPDITALWTRPDGTLWVRTGRGDFEREPGVLTTVDVIDPDGAFIQQKRLICPGDPTLDAIHFLPDGHVVVVTGALEAYRRENNTATAEADGGEERPLEVICYGSG